jgi:hypothetical protein
MPNETLISEIENLLADVIDLGGDNERSQIVPNLTVQDANPTNLDGWVIVSDDRDGDNILARKVGSVIYSDNDLVNVMFLRGTEPIAFQQGTRSSNNGIWEIVPSTSTDIYYDKGKVGIGTSTIPHGGVGVALLALEGTDFSEADGPHIQITTDFNDRPVMQYLHLGYDEIALNFDSYVDSAGNDISSAQWNNFQIQKSNGNFRIRYDTAVAAGGAISWAEGLTVNGTSGSVGIGVTSPAAKLESVSNSLAQLRLSHTFGSKYVDFTVDTNHDLTIKPSSTGQIICQSTTDQTNFFQVLDADGGNPVLNVDTTNERVGIGIATPTQLVHLRRDQNSEVSFKVENQTNGTGAVAGIRLASDGGEAVFGMTSQAYTAISGWGDSFFIDSNAAVTGGIKLAANSGNIQMYIGGRASGNIKLLLNSTGASIGHSGTPSTRLDIDAGAMEFAEMTAPGAGAANTARLYAEDNAGTTRQRVKFSSGNAVTIAEDGGLQTYTPTNVVTDRSYDANATTVSELADVLGTLIADFQAAGVLG